MSVTQTESRDAVISSMRSCGYSLQAIGDAHGRTREWARLYLLQMGDPVVRPELLFYRLSKIVERAGRKAAYGIYRLFCPLGPHGSRSTYEAGCRCQSCKAGAATNNLSWRRRARRDVAAGRRKINHGTLTSYTIYGCRCKKCVKTHAVYSNKYQARLRGKQGVLRDQ